MIIRTCIFVVIAIQIIFPLFAKTLTIGIHERPVYREKTEKGSWRGVDIDLMEAIFSQTPFDYEFVEYPWLRTLQSVETGKVDIALSAAKTEERKKFAWFTSVPFRPGHNVLYIDRQKLNQFKFIDSLSSLLTVNFKLGVIRGVSYSDRYDDLLANRSFAKRLVVLDSTARLPLMLLRGRIDGYLDSELGGLFRVNDNPVYKDRITVQTYITSDKEAQTFLMFSKKSVSEQEVEKVSLALAKVRNDGIYEKVLARYGLTPDSN